MRGFPGGGGAVLGDADQSADLQQGIGVTLRTGAGIRNAGGGGSGHGELFDQRSERRTVLGFEISLQTESPVATVPEPQLPGGGVELRLVTRLRTVGVELGENVSADRVQRRGVE
jgi:hypothetical protein